MTYLYSSHILYIGNFGCLIPFQWLFPSPMTSALQHARHHVQNELNHSLEELQSRQMQLSWVQTVPVAASLEVESKLRDKYTAEPQL